MDGYALATTATSAAIDRLRALHESGVVRVLLPLEGDFAAYAAVVGDTVERVQQKLDEIRQVDGLTGLQAFVALEPPAPGGSEEPTPTWGAVVDCLGFVKAKVEEELLPAVYDALGDDPLAVGIAVLSAPEPTLLVEYTAATLGEFQAVFDRVNDVNGVISTQTATGECAIGAGLLRR